MEDQVAIEDYEDVNDIPEGLARIEAMSHALKTAVPGEDPREILMRAGMFYAFLTYGKKQVMHANMGAPTGERFN